jgi:hypothetical protein
MAAPAFAPLLDVPGLVEFVAVTPDRFWMDRGRAAPRQERFADIPAWVGLLERAGLPTVSHHIGLSMASALVEPDLAYLEQMGRWARRWSAHWVSEHLAFVAIDGGDGPAAAGLALTAPFDREVLDLVVRRARAARAATGRPFLLENSPYFVTFDDNDMDEAEFLNRFCAEAGAGLLLDLHNLHCNAVNFGFSGHRFLDRLDLGNVIETHIAGGAELAGFWSDAHAGEPPEPVWDLLEDLLARAPNLRAITFEMHESWLPRLGFEGVARVLMRARALWQTRHATTASLAPA